MFYDGLSKALSKRHELFCADFNHSELSEFTNRTNLRNSIFHLTNCALGVGG